MKGFSFIICGSLTSTWGIRNNNVCERKWMREYINENLYDVQNIKPLIYFFVFFFWKIIIYSQRTWVEITRDIVLLITGLRVLQLVKSSYIKHILFVIPNFRFLTLKVLHSNLRKQTVISYNTNIFFFQALLDEKASK